MLCDGQIKLSSHPKPQGYRKYMAYMGFKSAKGELLCFWCVESTTREAGIAKKTKESKRNPTKVILKLLFQKMSSFLGNLQPKLKLFVI